MSLLFALLCLPGAQDALPLPDSTGWVVAGRVVDEAGAPVSGAEVTAGHLVSREPNAALEAALGSRAGRRAQTDAGGEFRVQGVTARELFTGMRVTAAGHCSHFHQQLLIAEDRVEEQIEIVLPRHYPVSGRVLDIDGRPLSGVQVYLTIPELGRVAADAPTGLAGTFRVPAAARGPMLVSIVHPTREVGLLMPALAEGGEQGLRLYAYDRPSEQGVLRVRVQDIEGRRVFGARLVLTLPERAGLPSVTGRQVPAQPARVLAGANVHEFRVPLGDWIIDVLHAPPELRLAAQAVTLSADSPLIERTLTLLPGGRQYFGLWLENPDGSPFDEGQVLCGARADERLDGVRRYLAYGAQRLQRDQLNLLLPSGPMTLELGGLGPRFEHTLLVAAGQRDRVLTVPARGTLRLQPLNQPQRSTALLRLWRPDQDERPIWLSMPVPGRWPPIGLEPGRWRWRLEYHPTQRKVGDRLPVPVLESTFELSADGAPQQLQFVLPTTLPLDG